MNETAQKIIALAELAIATKGYSGFSFRELATELDIKSASIHYHFPTKAHLGVAVVKRYRENYAAALQRIDKESTSPESALMMLINIYRDEIINHQRMTVCMMLAAEIKLLPDDIRAELLAFYHLNLEWLTHIARQKNPGFSDEALLTKSRQSFSLLQGAMLGAKTQGSIYYFDQAVAAISAVLF